MEALDSRVSLPLLLPLWNQAVTDRERLETHLLQLSPVMWLLSPLMREVIVECLSKETILASWEPPFSFAEHKKIRITLLGQTKIDVSQCLNFRTSRPHVGNIP